MPGGLFFQFFVHPDRRAHPLVALRTPMARFTLERYPFGAMWIFLSLLAALCFTVMFLLFKQLEIRSVPTVVSLAWIFIVGTLLYVGHVVAVRESLRTSGAILCILIAAGVLSYLGNAFQFRAISIAPNPGYAVAVVSVQALMVTIASVFLFGADFSLLKGFGALLCVVGVALLSFS